MSNSMADSSPPAPPPPETKKRKAVEKRSTVWDHFERIVDENGNILGKCNYCPKTYAADPKKHGTSSLRNHALACLKNPHCRETRQTMLAFGSNSESESVLTNWVFNQERVRKATARMIIMDELPFKFVEGRGWKQWVQEACPLFRIPSRWTVNRDIFVIYYEERSSLKKFFKEHSQRVSLTTDTWTSVQQINYMCLTAHYIDANWRLNKKIISFVPIQSHKGEAIARALECCLVEWGVKNITTITVDNAASNAVALGFLKNKLVSWGCSSVRAQYLHMRCVAHILNLVVQDGLKMAESSVKKLRDTVRWVRGSPARLSKFKDFATLLGVEEKSSLCLDVPTRWNSTYMMIRNAIPFRSVFEAYDGHDATLKLDLGAVLEDYDWVYLESFVVLLKTYYELTLRISGSLYITANTYFTEIVELGYALTEMIDSLNLTEKNMGLKMKEKFDKYWGDPEKMNLIIFFANILDPRDKVEYMSSQLVQLFGEEKGESCFRKIKSRLQALFEDYCDPSQPQSESQSQSQSEKGLPPSGKEPKFKSLLKKQKQESGTSDGKRSELDIYLGEPIVEDSGNRFDLLMWWSVNSLRFPILSKLARDVLAVPISTVASESTFSTSGRVLDNFRSSLTPKIVEALICKQDWLRGPTEPVSVEENLEELERFETEMENLRIGTSSSSVREDSPSTQASGMGGFSEDDSILDH